ncbi:MAG: flagellar hook-length control protein FliK [Alphaproteobacteria bacterium]
MQVSSVETAPGAGIGKEAAKPSQAASDAFAILLQNALTQNPTISKLRSPGESALADHLSADRPTGADRPLRDEGGAYVSDTLTAQADTYVSDTPAAQADKDIATDAAGAQQQSAPDHDKAAEGEADNPAALTNATEARISSGRTQADSATAAQQNKSASPVGAAYKPLVTEGNPAAGATQDAKIPVNSALRPEGDTGATASRATAQVIDGGRSFVSRPANTLSAAATLSAQTGAPEKHAQAPAAQAGVADAAKDAQKPSSLANGETGRYSGTPRQAEAGGNLLLNAGRAKPASANAGRTGQQTSQYAQTTPNGAAGNPAAQQQAAAPVQPAPPQPLPPTANSRPTPVMDRAGSLPVTESTPTVGAGQAGTPASASTARVAAPVPARPASPPSDLKEQISVQVQKAVEQGIDRIRIQLKPADLGRLEIQLDVAQDGKVAIVVNADRPETLEMLRRDARGLQQALLDAGLQTDSGGLSFNLGGGNASFGEQLADGARPDGSNGASTDKNDESGAATDTNPHRRSSNSQIDVEV